MNGQNGRIGYRPPPPPNYLHRAQALPSIPTGPQGVTTLPLRPRPFVASDTQNSRSLHRPHPSSLPLQRTSLANHHPSLASTSHRLDLMFESVRPSPSNSNLFYAEPSEADQAAQRAGLFQQGHWGHESARPLHTSQSPSATGAPSTSIFGSLALPDFATLVPPSLLTTPSPASASSQGSAPLEMNSTPPVPATFESAARAFMDTIPSQSADPSQLASNQQPQPDHVVGSQGRRGVLPNDPDFPPVDYISQLLARTAQMPEAGEDGKYPCRHCRRSYLHGKHLKRHMMRRE